MAAIPWDGQHCPFCGSESGELYFSDGIDAEGLTASQPAECLACEREWREVYTLAMAKTFYDDGAVADLIPCSENALLQAAVAVVKAWSTAGLAEAVNTLASVCDSYGADL